MSTVENRIVLAAMLILIYVSTGQALISAERTIGSSFSNAGSETTVTVIIQNDNIERTLSLKESIPTGWTLTRVTDDSNAFNANTNEWVWFTVGNNAVKTIEYKITAPSGTNPGTYSIYGVVISSTDQSTINIVGSIQIVGPVSTPSHPPETPFAPGGGQWLVGSKDISLFIGQMSTISTTTNKKISNMYIKVGCNDGETMDGNMEYFDGSNWVYVYSFTDAGCGDNFQFPEVVTNSIRVVMTNGGGVDSKI